MITKIIISTALFLLLTIPCQAREIYKWVDQHGYLHLAKKLPSNRKKITNVATITVTAENEKMRKDAREKFQTSGEYRRDVIARYHAKLYKISHEEKVKVDLERKRFDITASLEYQRILAMAYEMLEMENIPFERAPFMEIEDITVSPEAMNRITDMRP